MRRRVDRKQQLEAWLQQVLGNATFHLTTASADASFRRYFRVHTANQTMIAMDAPPPQEDCRPFVHVAELLLTAGLNVPKVIAQELDIGFLLLSDLGDTTYLSVIDADNAPRLYGDATQALIQMQLASQPNILPPYDEALLMREMQLFPDWYLTKHLNATLEDKQQKVLQHTFALLNQNILAQAKVIVHRDYHSRNLMVCEVNPGILDFQDAVYGPITYDLVSLLKDAYIMWDEEQIIDWAARYWQTAKKAGLPV
ncbi:MAG: aminoglycoside phosphotransferase, partial [Methylophilaceae bacterium 17-44-8]